MNTDRHELFFELVRAGLWEDKTVHDSWVMGHDRREVDWDEVYRLATEQSVLGLVLAGIEWFKVHVSLFTVPQIKLLEWIGEVQILEQQNKEMNFFIRSLFGQLYDADVNAVLVKGQGVAQSYEKPEWRSCGDVDLLMDENNYEKAKALLIPLADKVETENVGNKHLGIHFSGFLIELHGAMPFGLSKRVDKVVDEVIAKVNTDYTNGTDNLEGVAVPKADEHVVLVFSHFLHHFFIEGVGLKQLCDWCRLLWTYRSELDLRLLESRIKRMGLMTEWKAFASMAVDVLGMPEDAMPLFNDYHNATFSWWDRWRAKRVLDRIMKSGNMGHNNDLSYRTKYTGLTYQIVALWRRIKDFAGFTKIFPLDAPRFFMYYVMRKV